MSHQSKEMYQLDTIEFLFMRLPTTDRLLTAMKGRSIDGARSFRA
jgi:hypothetical protein